MTRHTHITAGLIVLVAGLLAGCDKKPEIVPPIADTLLDTAYVQVSPAFSGFTGPQDVFIGNDQLLYVADTKANRVVMLTRAGGVLSQRTMLHPIAIAQDSRLDLLVAGEVVAANGDTAGAVFRIHLVAAAHRLEAARIDTLWRELAKPDRRFPGIAVFGDNTYLIVRTGPDNSSFYDPDGLVLQFDKRDNFLSPVANLTTRSGSGITDIFKPTGIASFPDVLDFVMCQSSEGVAYGALWLKYEKSTEFDGWLPRFDPANPIDRNADFIRAGRFLQPEAVTIDRSKREVFVADAALDSVFKFSSRGLLKSESFGRTRTGGLMKRPTGLAFFEKVLYVADDSTGQILRFRLTTDVPR